MDRWKARRKWSPMDAEARRIMKVGNALAENWSVRFLRLGERVEK